jgi:hypothetical protein
MGISTHVVQSQDTPAQLITGLKYLGVRHDRDDFTCDDVSIGGLCNFAGNPSFIANAFIPAYKATGVTFLPLPGLGPGNTSAAGVAFNVANYDYWESLAPGAIYRIEGKNEPNNFPFTYLNASNSADPCGPGAGSYTGCVEAQAELYKEVKADPKLAGIPVYSFAEPGAEGNNAGAQFLTLPFASGEVAAGSKLADFAGLHNYFENNASGANGQVDNNAWSTFAPAQAEIDGVDGMDGEWCGTTFFGKFAATPYANCPSIPRTTTETGWGQGGAGISEDARGKLLINGYASAYARGVDLMIIYQMKGNDSFGLFDANMNPLAAATYIHNLTTILADPNPTKSPNPPAVTVTGTSSTDHWFVLQKGDLSNWLVIFADRPAGELSESWSFDKTPKAVFDPTVGTASGGTTLPELTDHMLVVEF